MGEADKQVNNHFNFKKELGRYKSCNLKEKESITRVRPILRPGSIFQEGDFSRNMASYVGRGNVETPLPRGEVKSILWTETFRLCWSVVSTPWGNKKLGSGGPWAPRQVNWEPFFAAVCQLLAQLKWGLSRTGLGPHISACLIVG